MGRLGDALSALLRSTQGVAWEAADRVWQTYDPDPVGGGPAYREAYAEEMASLDRSGEFLGRMLLVATE